MAQTCTWHWKETVILYQGDVDSLFSTLSWTSYGRTWAAEDKVVTDPQGIFCFSPHSLEAFTITVTLCSSRAEQMQSKGPGGRILSICVRASHTEDGNIAAFAGLGYDPVHSTIRRKNSLLSTLLEGWCRSHMNEGSYFTLGLQRAQHACLGSRERREWGKEEEERKQSNGTWSCP